MTASVEPSYRALLAVPSIRRVLVSMQLARVAQSMVAVALVLFTLDRYGSPAFAGLVTFASIMPGLLISPLAGALLDRHGRIRLVILDYVVALRGARTHRGAGARRRAAGRRCSSSSRSSRR